MAEHDGNFELQENAPRLGLHIEKKINNSFKASIQLEYGIHIIGNTQFNNDANSRIENVNQVFQDLPPFRARLTNFSFSHKEHSIYIPAKSFLKQL